MIIELISLRTVTEIITEHTHSIINNYNHYCPLFQMLLLLPSLVVGVVGADSHTALPVPHKGALLDDGGRDGKSFGLHTSLGMH